jgi:hypothetical protein
LSKNDKGERKKDRKKAEDGIDIREAKINTVNMKVCICKMKIETHVNSGLEIFTQK